MKFPAARIHYVENDADTRELVTMVLGSQNFHVYRHWKPGGRVRFSPGRIF
jgi:hypothetical protein